MRARRQEGEASSGGDRRRRGCLILVVGVELSREERKEGMMVRSREQMHERIMLLLTLGARSGRYGGVVEREIKRASATSTWSAILP